MHTGVQQARLREVFNEQSSVVTIQEVNQGKGVWICYYRASIHLPPKSAGKHSA
jgi:hypothetical protein